MLKNFRGSTMECLRHYAATLPKSDRAFGEAKKPLIAFTGAETETVSKWLRGKQPPVGVNLVKLRYFLELQGYCIAELGELPVAVRDFGRLVAYNVLGMKEALRHLEYTPQSLLAVLRGVAGASAHREQRMVELLERYRDQLRERQDAWKSTHGMAVAEPTVPLGAAPQPKSTVVAVDRQDRRFMLVTLAHLVQAGIPLAERVVSNDFAPEERQQLHELAGQYSVFRLSNLLNRLCSEKAREIIPDRNAGSQKPEARRRS